jgi:chromosome segregation ATPase
MNEDPTKKFSDGESFEARVLSGLAAIQSEQAEIRAEIRNEIAALGSKVSSLDERLTSVEVTLSSLEVRLSSLEEKVDARLRETRPIWESVLDNIKRLDLKFDEVLSDLFEVRSDVKRHERLILQLEKLR